MIPQSSLRSPEMTGVRHHSTWPPSVVCDLGLGPWVSGGPAELWLMVGVGLFLSPPGSPEAQKHFPQKNVSSLPTSILLGLVVCIGMLEEGTEMVSELGFLLSCFKKINVNVLADYMRTEQAVCEGSLLPSHLGSECLSDYREEFSSCQNLFWVPVPLCQYFRRTAGLGILGF